MTARVPLVCIGGSAGSLQTVRSILSGLSRHGNRAVVLGLHTRRGADDRRLSLLQESTDRQVLEIEDLDEIMPGKVFLCPGDYNVLIDQGTFVLTQFPTLFHSYPSIDSLFETYADEYGEEAIVVALSCANSDGLQGALRVKALGGTVVTQRREQVEYPVLIDAIEHVGIADYVLSETQIAELVGK